MYEKIVYLLSNYCMTCYPPCQLALYPTLNTKFAATTNHSGPMLAVDRNFTMFGACLLPCLGSCLPKNVIQGGSSSQKREILFTLLAGFIFLHLKEESVVKPTI